jgi:riboflavin synthase
LFGKTIISMFTGLIEDVGTIKALRLKDGAAVLTIGTAIATRELPLGASIAVNGACLTVVSKGKQAFTVDVSPETMQRTSVQHLQSGSLVNLERSMRLGDRLGGHLVTGHVDGLGTVRSRAARGDFIFFSFNISKELASFLVTKGSVAVDGISLTVNECNQKGFSVAIVPFTLEHTNLRALRVGDKVNIETDLIGKYVHKFVTGRG